MQLLDAIHQCPLIAILRGVKPSEVVAIGQAIVNVGFTIIEVPLNSPEDPLASIHHLTTAFGDRILIGAGTVVQREQVKKVAESGGRLIISPHTDPAIIQEAKQQNLFCMPGFSTPTEAFAAINAGADALKFFPAGPPTLLKALKLCYLQQFLCFQWAVFRSTQWMIFGMQARQALVWGLHYINLVIHRKSRR